MGQLGDLSPGGSIAIGIFVGLLSTSIQSLGLTLQRKSHLLEDGKDDFEARRPAYKRRRWQLGMGMFVLSNIVGSTIQITTLPLPVLSTLQAAGLVFNTAFATLLLKEPFTRFSAIGTILTCGGAAIIATFGAIGEPAHTLSQLLGLLAERGFILWMVGTLLVACATIVFAHLLKIWDQRTHHRSHHEEQEQTRSWSMSSSHPEIQNLKRSFTAKLPPVLQNRIARLRLIRGLSYALVSGILSAHSLLVAKSAVELLVRTIVDHVNQFNRYQSWLILLALVFFALAQLYYLHLGLRLCSTSVLYPFVFCIYNIIAILDGLIYFQQGSRLSALHAGLIAIGTVVLLSGVLALSWRLDDGTPSDLSAAQHAEPPPNPLTPGMGLVHSSEDSLPSPTLPTTRPRSSTSASRPTTTESTPLLFSQRRRVPTLTINPPPPNPGTRSIWAELDDEIDEGSQDILSSLPRTPSPFLTQSSYQARRRSRGLSLTSTAANSTSSLVNPRKRGSGGSTDSQRFVTNPKRAQTIQTASQADRRRSSAPGWTENWSGTGKSPVRGKKLSPDRRAAFERAKKVDEEANGSVKPNSTGGEETLEEERNGDANVGELERGADATDSDAAPGAGWAISRWWQGRSRDSRRKDEDPGG